MGIDISYLAGFIDGEGCFWADEKLRMSPILDIANTNLDILSKLGPGHKTEK